MLIFRIGENSPVVFYIIKIIDNRRVSTYIWEEQKINWMTDHNNFPLRASHEQYVKVKNLLSSIKAITHLPAVRNVIQAFEHYLLFLKKEEGSDGAG